MTVLEARSSSASIPDAALTASITVSAETAQAAVERLVHVEVGLEAVAGGEHDGSADDFAVFGERGLHGGSVTLQPFEKVEVRSAVARREAEKHPESLRLHRRNLESDRRAIRRSAFIPGTLTESAV